MPGRALWDSLPLAALVLDPVGGALDANPAACAWLGYSRAELLALPAGALIESPGTYRAKDGSLRRADVRQTPIRHRGRQATLVLLLDAGPRRAAESARDAAVQSLQNSARFLAHVSHEIRTPMNGIIGMTQLALETDLNREQREFLGMAKQSADALLSLINDILDFSKIEAGRMDLDLVEFDLRDNVENSVHTLAQRAAEKGIELACSFSPDVPARVSGDPGRLRQILVNLVGNAVKFTDRGEVVVRVAPQDGRLRFTVSDTGIGIPADKLDTVFQSFAQAESNTARRYGGTGLGLAICRQLVNLMGGEIQVSSQVGRGSTFGFAVALPPAPLAAQPAHLPETSLEGVRALVVDDSETVRGILCEVLRSWGMTADPASGCAHALALMQEAAAAGRPYRAALVDCGMPGADGFDFAELARSLPELPPLAIVMLTSAGHRGDAARCRKLGIAAYLHKPVKRAELKEALLLSLETAGGEAPLLTRHTLRGRREVLSHNQPVFRLRILLAENDEVSQKLAVRMLEKMGHSLVTVGNGAEALDAIKRQPFDLVFMDVQMPVMDGFEATAAIREHEKSRYNFERRIPVFAMTANAMKGDREKCLSAGMDGYVSKPIDKKDLEEVVQQIAGHTATDPVEPSAQPAPFDKTALLDRVDQDRELLGELIQLFLEDCPRLLGKVEQAVLSHDAASISATAHTMKGSVGNFCAPPAFEAANRLETIGREGALDQAAPAWETLSGEMGRLRAALESLAVEVAP